MLAHTSHGSLTAKQSICRAFQIQNSKILSIITMECTHTKGDIILSVNIVLGDTIHGRDMIHSNIGLE